MNRFTAFRAIAALLAFFPLGETSLHAQLFQFHFPTANHALFEPGAQDQFFVGTAGKPWTSGCFGCVRSDGGQLHEGLDIRCLRRDMKGEPSDPVFASAAGDVTYINRKPSLSNYGNYIVIRHQIEGMEIYTLYAHLSEVREDLHVNSRVRTGDNIAVMGRTSNTRERISRERAHVHFEMDFFVNDRFESWYKKNLPGERNDHGVWNGQNLVGLDPRLVLLEENSLGRKFSLVRFIQTQTPLCRVLVRAVDFPWLKRCAPLVRPNAVAQKEGVAGYELALNYNGLPFELTPRAASEIKGTARVQLLSVNEAEARKNPCRKLVTQRGGRWQLANNGERLIELLVN